MSEDYSAKIWKILLIILTVAFGLRFWLMMDAHLYKGEGFVIEFPEGWTEWEIPEEIKKQRGKEFDKIHTITYVSFEIDDSTGVHDASISIISYKLDQAAWIDDEFPRILKAIERGGNFVVKEGQIEIDKEIARWVLFHDKKNQILNLEFYIITGGNMFFKIHYAADDRKFKLHRPAFEKARESFKITVFRL